jgi:choline-glycine betaine transporter
MTEVLHAIRQRRTSQPRTVLSFFWGVLALLVFGCSALVGVLAKTDAAWLIPWVLLFAAIVFVVILLVVVIAMLRDPSKLMLGELRGTEYLRVQTARLGDSTRGDTLVVVEQTTTSENVSVTPDDNAVGKSPEGDGRA